MNAMAKNLLRWVVIAIVLIVVFQTFNPRTETQNIPYTDFLTQVENNTVKQVTISAKIPATIPGKSSDNSRLTTTAPIEDPDLMKTLRAHNVEVSQDPPDTSGPLWRMLI